MISVDSVAVEVIPLTVAQALEVSTNLVELLTDPRSDGDGTQIWMDVRDHLLTTLTDPSAPRIDLAFPDPGFVGEVLDDAIIQAVQASGTLLDGAAEVLVLPISVYRGVDPLDLRSATSMARIGGNSPRAVGVGQLKLLGGTAVSGADVYLLVPFAPDEQEGSDGIQSDDVDAEHSNRTVS